MPEAGFETEGIVVFAETLVAGSLLSGRRVGDEKVVVAFTAGLAAVTGTAAFAGIGVVATAPFFASCAGKAGFAGIALVAFDGLLDLF